MNHKRPILLLLLVLYIFAPTIFSWIIDPEGAWYRPFLIWVLVIVITYIIQSTKEPRNANDF